MMYNYSYFSVEMSAEAFASVNVPFSAVSVLLNIFFIYCMVVPQQGAEQLKDPLKVLLGSLIGCNIIIHSCSFLIVLTDFVLYKIFPNWFTSYVLHNLTLSVMMYTVMTIITSCYWRNVFYFCQIVPLQHSVFIWFKRNMRGLIRSALILSSIFCLFGMAVSAAYEIVIFNLYIAYNSSDDAMNALFNALQVKEIILVGFWIRVGIFLLSLCVMLSSSCAVVLYLWRHMKNMEDSGLISPSLQRRIKMTITGITMQVLLHFLCSDGLIIFQIITQYSDVDVDWNGNILCTIISLYSFGTTVNMMVGQSLFRQRAVHAWRKLLQSL
ncbi:taste receptor type 2 member 42-like [Pygocentrus nattereri]|uniref:taste receptor type 2 member 42-like n=1 Tax=Pygocentrus nattereri TaxID=42514 RepID=UPI0018912FC0|nr:taste receptor type 2 member 42-like [Pygocentrus nattereri]